MNRIDLSITALHERYRASSLAPADVIDYILKRCQQYEDYHIWISLLSRNAIAPYINKLANQSPDSLPLYGIPFAIKDNIDLAGVPTTVACPAYSYIPDESAFVVQQLINAGAIPIGKTNLDQFATGLTGTRSPYGAVKNSINPDYISGGSSSGSAVATALDLVSFALGTDTAGSGRVPAMFNKLIGIKPSCGVVSTRGVVPACKSLDCVCLLTRHPDDIKPIYSVMAVYDDQDSYARIPVAQSFPILRSFRFGVVPEAQLPGFTNPEVGTLMHRMQEHLKCMGGMPVEIDYTPFQQAAELLYEGPWVAERYAVIEKFIQSHPDALHPVTRSVISKGADFNAVDTYRAMYRLQELKRLAERELAGVDFILTPTAVDIYTIQQLEEDPVKLNTQLGYYTNFMNLLDYAAIAIPAGYFSNGLPFGVTLFADKFSDSYLIELARRILTSNHPGTESNTPFSDTDDPTGTGETDRLKLVVCGAHLKGMPLNHQLTDLGAFLLESTTTAPSYRLYCLSGGPPYRPGLIKNMENGTRIAVEVWSIPVKKLGDFLGGIPAPLGLGKVELYDGTEVTGFICEAYAITQAEDISEYGGWKNYINSI